MLGLLRRGVFAGAVGGVLAAAFGYVLAEPLMDRAVDLEAARSAAAGETGAETFSRSTQHFGFLGALIVVGIALGVLYSVVHRLQGGEDTWSRALRLGAAGFFAFVLVPFLRYPPNPPGVGDSGTIELRSHLWQLSIVIGLTGAAAAGLAARQLRDRGTLPPYRQLVVLAVLVATVALTFLLPGNTDPVNAPLTLVWDFRLLSLASQLLLWGGLAATFGLMAERRQVTRTAVTSAAVT